MEEEERCTLRQLNPRKEGAGSFDPERSSQDGFGSGGGLGNGNRIIGNNML